MTSNRTRDVATLAAALGLASACERALLDPNASLVVYNAHVWDGTGAPLTEPSVIQVGSDGRILSIVLQEELRQDEIAALSADVNGDRFVNAETGVVIPGLVNAHGHVAGTWVPASGSSERDYATGELARYARFGVTTVNSLGGDREASFGLRDESWSDAGSAVPEGSGLGRARLLVSGPVLYALTPEEIVLAVDALAPMRPDWIKFRVDDNLGASTKMPQPVYEALITRARDHGMRAASHLFYEEDAQRLLRAGTGLVAHSIRDRPVSNETIELFHQAGVCYVPTLVREVSTYVHGERPDFLDDPFFASDVDSTQLAVVSDSAYRARIRASGAAEAYGRALRIAQENLATLALEGVPIAFGTDSGPMGRFQGYFEHMEVELMAEAGLTPEQILRSATGVAADCLERDDIGVLEAGRRADFIVLRSNPLRDLTALRDIAGVWVGGMLVEGSRRQGG